jgi:hypothetical protein
MARNEDSENLILDDDDDDQYSHRSSNPSALQMPPSSSTQLITLDQHGSLEDGGPTHYEVH